MSGTVEYEHGFAKADSQSGLIAFNLTVMPWQVGSGLGDGPSSDWSLTSATGGETMFADHLIGELRKKLRAIEDDRDFCRILQQASQDHGEMIVILPREGRVRHETFGMLESMLDRIGCHLRRFTTMRLYLNQEPSETRNCVRKFKGARSTQLLVNLSEYGYRFFRFHGKQHEDINIDSMLPMWSDIPEEHVSQLEGEIRMFDMSYFRRIRETAESGTTYLMLPRGTERRARTIEAFTRILGRVPTGAIDLTHARIRRIYPGLTKTGEIL